MGQRCEVASFIGMFTLSLQNIFDSDRYGAPHRCHLSLRTVCVGTLTLNASNVMQS